MSFAGKLFRFFIYSNLFIACCAVLMVHQTCNLLLNNIPGPYFIGFIFFATITSYSFHWYLTPAEPNDHSSRTEWLKKNRNLLLAFLVTGLAGVIVSAFFLLDHWHWLLVSAFITFLYSAPKIPHPYFRLLRKVALGKTLFLALTWTYVTSVLPIQVVNAGWNPVFPVFALHRFFLIYAICVLFDVRDREYDKKVGIRSLVTWLGENGIRRLFVVSLFLFLAATIWLAWLGQPFLVVMLLLIPGIITGLLYHYAVKNHSDTLYYFILDGLMALSSILTLFISH